MKTREERGEEKRGESESELKASYAQTYAHVYLASAFISFTRKEAIESCKRNERPGECYSNQRNREERERVDCKCKLNDADVQQCIAECAKQLRGPRRIA